MAGEGSAGDGSDLDPSFPDPDRRSRLARGFAEVDRVFAEARERHRIPGVAYGVVVDGKLSHAGGVGLRQLEGQAEAGPDTVFRIASMTKSITAACVLLLRDEGRLALDDPIADHVPQLAGLRPPTRDSAPITIRNLLNMAGGFVEDDPWADRHLAMTESEFDAILAAGIPFDWAPGLVFEYSNLGYGVLGRIVREVSGVPATELASSRLFRPLGMADTLWEVARVPTDRIAQGYRLESGDWVAEPPLANGAFAPMGGLWTTIDDFAKYVGLQLRAWPARDDPDPGPIRRSSLREMQQALRLSPAPDAKAPVLQVAGYAFGLIAGQHPRDGRVVMHSGGLPGFGSNVRWLPDHGVGVIGFGNLTYSPMQQVVAEAVDALAATGALIPRSPAPSRALLAAREAVIRLYQDWDQELAEQLAADNLFQDVPAQRRREEFKRLRTEHGSCREALPLVASGAMRGSWRMLCQRGALEATIWLAPTTPPRVQVLRLGPVPEPPPRAG